MLIAFGLFCLSGLLGLFLIQIVWRLATGQFPAWFLSAFLGLGIGAGISSFLFTANLFLIDTTPLHLTFLWVEIIGLLGLIAGWVFLRKSGASALSPAVHRAPFPGLLLGVWIIGLAFSVVFFFQASAQRPIGDWDGWTLWNLHAKFLAFGGSDWKNIFTEPLHPDYPLLTSGLIARLWVVLGNDHSLAPIFTAALYTFGTLGLLMAVLKEFRGWKTSLSAGLILACSTGFIQLGADQYADVPLSFYFLALLALILCHDLRFPQNNLLLLLAGLCAGFCLWTKNEGWLMLLALVSVRLLTQIRFQKLRQSLPEWGFFLAGLAPLLLITLYYRHLAPTNDLITAPLKSLAQITDPSRYVIVWKALNTKLLELGEWKSANVILLLALLGFGMGYNVSARERQPVAFLGLTLLVLLMGYFFTYILTPRDLVWHLETSLNRLLMQIYPAILLLFFLLINLDAETTESQGFTFKRN